MILARFYRGFCVYLSDLSGAREFTAIAGDVTLSGNDGFIGRVRVSSATSGIYGIFPVFRLPKMHYKTAFMGHDAFLEVK